MIIKKEATLFSESSTDESVRIASIIKELLKRTNLTSQEIDQLTITIFIPRLFSKGLHPAIYIYPTKVMKVTPNCTEYDFYHELGHHAQNMRYEFASISNSHREVFANEFMRMYGKPSTQVFKSIRKGGKNGH